MRAFHHIDRVELNKTDASDESEHLICPEPVGGPGVECVFMEKQSPGSSIRDDEPGWATTAIQPGGVDNQEL
jgi:hypothetical protein